MSENKTITIIPGDGIGPEIMDAVVEILSKVTDLEFEYAEAGQKMIDRFGFPLPGPTLETIKKNVIALKGPIMTPVGKGFRSVNVLLRQNFLLYANVRPVRSVKGTNTRYDNVDLVIFRENTQGLYSGLETFDPINNIADSIARISRKASLDIIHAAFKMAQKRPRKKLTLAHKANILKLSQGLFLDIGREVAKEYPDVEFEDKIIDNMAMQLVMRPEQFDVVVTTNLFGDIISDLCAGLVGGLGLVPGANIGHDVSIFEAVHGTAPDIAGKGLANPTALLMSAVMMLQHMEMFDAADNISNAAHKVISEGKYSTRDLGGNASTQEYKKAIIDNLV